MPLTPLYAVLSETLWETIPVTDEGEGPCEPYAIFEIVAARNRSAAIYRAWQEDKSFDGDIKFSMPRFRAIKLGMTRRPPGVYTDDERVYRRWPSRVWQKLQNFST